MRLEFSVENNSRAKRLMINKKNVKCQPPYETFLHFQALNNKIGCRIPHLYIYPPFYYAPTKEIKIFSKPHIIVIFYLPPSLYTRSDPTFAILTQLDILYKLWSNTNLVFSLQLTCIGESFFIKVQACNFILKKTPALIFLKTLY